MNMVEATNYLQAAGLGIVGYNDRSIIGGSSVTGPDDYGLYHRTDEFSIWKEQLWGVYVWVGQRAATIYEGEYLDGAVYAIVGFFIFCRNMQTTPLETARALFRLNQNKVVTQFDQKGILTLSVST